MTCSYLESLGIPEAYWCATSEEDAVLLASKVWCRELETRGCMPGRFPRHASLSDAEVQSAVRERALPDASWTLLNLWRVTKPADTPACLPEPAIDGGTAELTFSELLQHVARDRFCHSWQGTADIYPDVYPEGDGGAEPALAGAHAVLRQLLYRTYGQWPRPAGGYTAAVEAASGGAVPEPWAGLQSALAVLELADCFLVVSPLPEFTLRHAAHFAYTVPADNSQRAPFVGYQLLRAICELHARGVCAGDFRPEDVAVEATLWLQLRPRLDGSLCQPASAEQRELRVVPDPESRAAPVVELAASLSQLTLSWWSRRISNLSYLLALNHLAGRRFGDPGYHPVVPWVTDLSQQGAGWRDLTRSKYRLNKGDEQLDMQYKAGAAAADQAPHHISDVLSEITYYVYMARRTPKSVLCKHVRAQWVPGEYPTSLVRLYALTPDECVPQFYTDPSVFKSIHADMADLELPEWAPTADSFIARHRAALESDQVSAQLHHWIDLTFGYKLTGEAAVRAKNVTRHLAESGDTLQRSGVLQLFSAPHPPRQTALLYFSSMPPPLEDFATTRRESACRDEVAGSPGRHEPSPEKCDSLDSELRSLVPVSAVGESAVQLPRGYEPLAALQRVEALGAFCAATGGALPATGGRTPMVAATRLVDERRLRDLAAWLCVLAELGAPAAFRTLPQAAPLHLRLEAASQAMCSVRLPTSLSRLAELVPLLAPVCRPPGKQPDDTDGTTDAGPPPSLRCLLQPAVSPLPLPPHARAIYAAVAEYQRQQRRHRRAAESAGERSAEAAAAADFWVRRFGQRLAAMLDSLTGESLQLLVPHVVHLLKTRATCVLAAWHVFSGVAERLGPARARHVFLQPLLGLYQRDMITCKSMKLFHRSFLLHIAVRLGHATFAAHFIPPLIEAVGGDRDLLPETSSVSARTDSLQLAGDATCMAEPAGGADQGVFHMDEEAEVAVSGERPEPVARGGSAVGSEDARHPADAAARQRSPAPADCRISDVAAESVMWLAHRLGPALTSRYLARNLLRMLAVCYSDAASLRPAMAARHGVCGRPLAGDASAASVLRCLCSVAELYGTQLVVRQYVPHVAQLCCSARRKLTPALESALIGGLTLLLHVLPYLSDAQLVQLLHDCLLPDVLQPVLETATDTELCFPCGGAGRAATTHRWLSLLVLVTDRIGPEMALSSLRHLIRSLVATFGRLFKKCDSGVDQSAVAEDSDVTRRARAELARVFTPSLADAVWVPLCRLLQTLSTGASEEDAELIRDLCALHRQQAVPHQATASMSASRSIPTSGASSHPDSGAGFGSMAAAIGNRIYVESDETADLASTGAPPPHHRHMQMAHGTRHLHGAWQAYWLNELAQVDSHLSPKQILLQSFEGHTGAVRDMHVLDNENSFLSAGKDRTVRLWSVRSQGDGGHRSTPQWTYAQHRRSVAYVTYLSGRQRAASADAQTLHLWDPFIGATESVLELGSVTALAVAAVPCGLLVCGSGEPLVRLVDPRAGASSAGAVCQWRTAAAGAGSVRSLATPSPQQAAGYWLAVGHTQGALSVLDVRTGGLLATHELAHGEVRQVVALGADQLVTCVGGEPHLSVWSATDGRQLTTLRGLSEPAQLLLTDGDDVITGASTNRLGVFWGRDADAVFSPTKLKPECFKGVLSAIALLSANRLLLLGSEQGPIRLIY